MKRIFFILLSVSMLASLCPSVGAADTMNTANKSVSPIIRYTADNSVMTLDAEEPLPAEYDTRQKLTLPAIRNQGLDGDCWAYASIAAAEISILKSGGSLFDFSEAHMADNIYFKENNPWSLDQTTGGNRETAAMYFSRGSGPVPEDSFSKDDTERVYNEDISENLAAYINSIIYLPDTERYIHSPHYTEDSAGAAYPEDERYTLANDNGNNTINAGYEAVVPYDDYEVLRDDNGTDDPGDDTMFFNIGKKARDEQIKRAIMKYGSVFTSYYADPQNKYLNKETSAYFYPYSTKSKPGHGDFRYIEELNHAVSLVGWNDGFPKERFDPMPPANGAWIVRNSWGENVLENGYFYISYYDSTIGENSAIFTDVETDVSFDAIYQYDPFGQTGVFEMPSGTWAANRYDKRTEGDEYITEVGVYCYQPNTKIDIAVNQYDQYSEKSFITWYNEEYADSIENFVKEDETFAYRSDHPMAESIKSQTFELPGYYVIKLDNPVKIETESFDVAVRYSDAADGETVGVPAEVRLTEREHNSHATAGENESFLLYYNELVDEDNSTVAEYESWGPMISGDGESEDFARCNACIKVMTTANPYPEHTVSVSDESGNVELMHGGAAVAELSARAGDVITVRAKLRAGGNYKLSTAPKTDIKHTENQGGYRYYSFVMPDSDVVVNAEWKGNKEPDAYAYAGGGSTRIDIANIESGTVIAAKYDEEGNLLGFVPVSADSAEKTEDGATLTIEGIEANRVFIWKDLNSMMPLVNALVPMAK